MADVYRLANKTWISLGDGEDEEQSLEEMLRLGDYHSKQELPEIKGIFQNGEPQKHIFDAFNTIFSSTWFQRVWTLQEFLLSSSPTFFGRSASITWKSLEDSASLLNNASGEALKMFNRVTISKWTQSVMVHAMMTNQVNQPSIMLVIRFLQISRSLLSFDPRDRIYGMYHIFHEFEIDLVEPDYAKPVQLLYEETAIALTKQFGNLFVLEMVSSVKRMDGLPSWVPDYSQPSPQAGFILEQNPPQRYEGFRENIQTIPHQLNLRGKRAGIVKSTAMQMPFTSQIASDISSCEPSLLLKCIVDWATFVFHLGAMIIDEEVVFSHFQCLADLLLAAMQRQMLSSDVSREGSESQMAQILQLLSNFLFLGPEEGEEEDWSEIDKSLQKGDLWNCLIDIASGTSEHTLFLTDLDMIGLEAGSPQDGDSVVLIFGAQVPLIIRAQGNDQYQLVGVAMMNESKDFWPKFHGEDELENLVLI